MRGDKKVISIPVSSGELSDKTTILLIKSEEINDESQLKNIYFELASLEKLIREFSEIEGFQELFDSLKLTNKKIWNLMEYVFLNFQRNDAEYVNAVNETISLNKERSYLKKKIDLLTGSSISEAKSYFNS